MATRQIFNHSVNTSNGTVYVDGNRTDQAPLLNPFTLEIRNAKDKTVVSVDGIEVYPRFRNCATVADNTITIVLDKPFCSWFHVQMGRGWILYDHTTY
jgi:hypothetical protein